MAGNMLAALLEYRISKTIVAPIYFEGIKSKLHLCLDKLPIHPLFLVCCKNHPGWDVLFRVACGPYQRLTVSYL